ncbi:B-box-type zinc finger [Trinorchestia longiramus]|nr:B-box-type zinc finger [Trinorchestia longiramus]
MDSSIHECGICNEIYNSGDHKPLFLECGHTCCLWCMFQMEKPSGINCPRCRKFTPKQVYQLPVNFDLIPAGDQGSAGTARSAPVALCVNHGSDLDCLCATCGDLVCQHCKKDVHAGHKVKSLRSITGSVKATDARIEFRHKLQRKLDRLTASLTAPRELLQMIEEIKSDVEEWRDSLLASQTSVEQDLRLWDTLGSCPGQEGSVKDVVYRMKRTELSHEYKKRQIKAKLDEVGKKYFEESMTELLPHRGIWMINNEVTAANALMSLTAGREPVESIVTSLPSWPLPQLPKLLKELGEVSVAVDVRLADFFWSPSLEKDPRLQTFIQNYGHKICGFLGSPDDVLAVCHARGEASLVVGVRLATMTDVDRCTALKHTPRSQCI